MGSYVEEIIRPGDAISRLAKEVNERSYGNCPAVAVVPHEPGNFRGPVGIALRPHIMEAMHRNKFGSDGRLESWEMLLGKEIDGAGGKPGFFTLVGTPEVMEGLACEIVAMTADDFARSGRLPLWIGNQLDVQRLTSENMHLAEALFRGYERVLREARLVSTTGETAVMKYTVTAFCDERSDSQLCISWSATCVGLTARNLLLRPKEKIRPGMPIVGFRERGYRCNGGGKLVEIMMAYYGHEQPRDLLYDGEAVRFAKALCMPSQVYAPVVTRLCGWNPDGSFGGSAGIVGAAHITGGGLNKLREIMPEGVGACLGKMPPPPQALLEAQRMANAAGIGLSDEECHTTFHGGCGMLLVCEGVPPAMQVVNYARQCGIDADIVGQTVSSSDSGITVVSRFNEKRGEEIEIPRA